MHVKGRLWSWVQNFSLENSIFPRGLHPSNGIREIGANRKAMALPLKIVIYSLHYQMKPQKDLDPHFERKKVDVSSISSSWCYV